MILFGGIYPHRFGFFRVDVETCSFCCCFNAICLAFVLMFNVDPSTSSGGSTGGGLFNICLKWSLHLASWSSVFVKIFPSASLIGAFADVGFPLSCLVMLYSVLMSPLLQAFSAS